jgi:hypothetical protein
MNQALYALMNNKRKMKKKRLGRRTVAPREHPLMVDSRYFYCSLCFTDPNSNCADPTGQGHSTGSGPATALSMSL